jgi:hypothetical protein
MLCVGLAWSAAASAQATRPVHPANSDTVSYAALDKLPDWRGLWFPAIGKVGGTQPQLIGEARKTWEAHQAQLKANPRYEVPETSDNCEPDGMPSLMTFPYNLEFLFTPGKVTIIQEALMQVRRIFTDGRPLPAREALDPNYFGYSVGRWEGETLVVTTIGTRPGQRLGIAGIVNSDQLTITERIYLDPKDRDLLPQGAGRALAADAHLPPRSHLGADRIHLRPEQPAPDRRQGADDRAQSELTSRAQGLSRFRAESQERVAAIV